jgi:hypothetical protein
MQYQIIYKKGADNGVADVLSKHPNPLEQVMVVSTIACVCLDKVKQSHVFMSIVRR